MQLNSRSVNFKSLNRKRFHAENLALSEFRLSRQGQSKAPVRNSHGNLAEFGPALLLYFALVLAPSLALIRLGASITALSFAAGCAAEAASKAPCYDRASVNARCAIDTLVRSPLWGLSGLKPDAIKSVNLFVDEQVIASGERNASAADKPLQKPVNPGIDTYEYDLQISYQLEPILPMGGFPFLGKVPLLTDSAQVTARALRPVEYLDGLSVN